MMRQFGIGVGLLLAMAATLDAQLRPVRPGVGGEAPKSMTLDEALTKIKSKDTRLTAVIALADHGVKAAPAIDDLIDALRDANEDLRLNAAITLGKIGKPAVGPVAKLLTATDAGLRFYAVWTLGWIGPDAAEAAPALIRTLADADDNVRRKAAYSLGRVASPSQPGEAIPVLMKAFEDKNDDVRQAAADAVANFGGKAVRPLIGVVESSTPVARLAAIAALGKIGGDAKDAIPVLKAFLLGSEGHPNLVADALGKIGKASIPVLLEGVDSGKTPLREHCISALGHIGADAASALVDLLGHKSVEVRRAAAGTLTPLRIGDKMVVLGLAYASHDPDTQVRHHAFQALQALGISAKLAAPKLNDLLVDADPNLRQQAFNLLRSIGEDPLPGLKKALDSKDQSLRINTAALMMQVNLDRPLVAPILREALTSKNPDINIQAAVALAGVRQNVDEVVPVLIEGLKNKNAGVRQSAIAGLQSVGAKDAVQATPTLIALLEDTEIGNVVQVVYLIRNLNLDPERTVPPLLKLLTRNDPQLQTAVLQMIANSGDRGLDAAVKVFKESKDANQRSQIIRFLAYSKENRTKAMPLISEAAKDPSPQTRVAVMHLISYLHQRNEETFQIFAGGVNDDAETVRSAAAQAAYIFVANAELSGKAVQLLETRLVAEKDRAVKISLLQGLSNMARKTKTSVPVLVGCLKDDVPQVRWTAAQALANLGAGAKDAIPALESLRDDPDPTVRQIVANAIARIK